MISTHSGAAPKLPLAAMQGNGLSVLTTCWLYFALLPPSVNDGGGFCRAKQVRTRAKGSPGALDWEGQALSSPLSCPAPLSKEGGC